MNRKIWIVGILSLGLLLSSCNEYTVDENVKIFNDRAKIAKTLNLEVYDAIEMANSDVSESIEAFEDICPRAKQFQESQYGEAGWEPGEYPEEYGPYETAMTASYFACYFSDQLKEKRWGDFASYSAQFFQYYKCFDQFLFTHTEACPPYGLFAE